MNKLKEVRLAAGYTQEELAAMIGSTKSYISRLETGTRDIKQIRQNTMQKICDALHCQPQDLFVSAKAKLEYAEDGKLIVDKLWIDPRNSYNDFVVEISGEFFLMRWRLQGIKKKISESELKPMIVSVAETAEEAPPYLYVMQNCVPRTGFEVTLNRAITESELNEFCKKYNITDDDMSKEFIDTKGPFYGHKYEKPYTAIQVRVASYLNPITLADELIDKGIEAGAIDVDRINIRIR